MNQVANVEQAQPTGPVNVYEIVEFQQQAFNEVLTTDDLTWAKESQFAIQALQKNEVLNSTAWRNQVSLQNAIVNVATIGITLNPALKLAYLVPRDGAVCLDLSYMGLMHLAQDAGAIEWGQAKLVYQYDSYKNLGLDVQPWHEYSPFLKPEERGEIVGAYCTVKIPSGAYLTEEMSRAQLEQVRASSKAQNGPWKHWYDEMCRKTVVKRGSKYWPKCERLAEAIRILDQHEGLAERTPQRTAKQNAPFQSPDDTREAIQILLDNRGADSGAFFTWLSENLNREVAALTDLTDREAAQLLHKLENSAK